MSSNNFNSAVLPANGDVIMDLGIFENVKPRSDFFIAPPRMHVEPSVEQAIKDLQQNILDFSLGWSDIVMKRRSNLEEKIEECQKEIERLREKVDDKNDHLERTRAMIEKNYQEINEAKKNIVASKSIKDEALENKGKLEDELSQLKAGINPGGANPKRVTELEKEIKELQGKIDGLETQLMQLEKNMDAFKEKADELEDEKEDLQKSMDSYEQQLSDEKARLKGASKELARVEKDLYEIKGAGGPGGLDLGKISYYKSKYNIPKTNGEQYVLKSELMSAGITGEIAKTTQRLRRSSFDNNLKLLLSYEAFYIYCLYKAYKEENVKDAEGLFNRVVHYADLIQNEVNAEAAKKYFSSERLDKGSVDQEEFIANIASSRFPYEEQKAKAFFKKTLKQLMTFGNLPKYVEKFFHKGELPANMNTPAIKYKMVEHLYKMGLKVDSGKFDNGDYDEYFANAFTIAAKLDGSAQDPVKNVYSDVKVDNFDFDVDYFETIEEQSIDRQNILAAAVLFYNKVLADDLGILRIADAVIMAWTQGRLDIPQGETATKLYRYYKLRKERTTTEERAMFYKVVFNSGNAEVLENSVVNNEFGELWTTLMKETVKYIQKYETRDNAIEYVSKVGVYNAIKNLQYNLSVFMSGMVKSLLPEMYAQLQSAIEILKQPEIVQQLGQGYHRNMWKVIERVSAEAFNIVPNVSALRTIAVKGHSIFKAMAQFDEAQFAEEDFRNFIGNVEEFIVANGQIEMKDYEGEEEGELVAEEKDEWDF